MGTNSYNYAYDPIGNRLTAAVNAATNVYASNPLNQYTNISGGAASSPTYDADGNMLTCALLTGEWYFFWDGENRLVCASNAETLVRNTYDSQSRRISKEVFAFSQATANFEPVTYNSFLWDNWNVIREIATAYGNSVTNYYTWGLDLSGSLQGVPLRQGYGGQAGGVGGLLAVTTVSQVTGTFASCYPVYDANGNVTDYLDANGNNVAHREYSAFGETVVQTGPLVDSFTYWWSTKPWCPVTGLSEYQLRAYSPELGRWMSRDPIGEEKSASQNLYNMVWNSPLDLYDAFGLFGAGRRKLGDYIEYQWHPGKTNFDGNGTAGYYEYVVKVPWGHSDFTGGDFFDFVKEDTDWRTSPTPWGEPSAHFQELTKSETEIEKALLCCDRDKFERAMHKGQDWFSHGKKGYVWRPFHFLAPNLGVGHFFDTYFFGKDPDDDKNAWDDAESWGLTGRFVARWYETGCPHK
jgi:RHS repeat-associated protein